ncbi:MAG: hypothetical protein JWP85_1934 [Rhodoglobus sp.]|nr:hypothetical protein [Rhodoglobus sp.]
MNATVTTAPGRQDHPPHQSSLEHEPYRARRVNLLDRVALHVGIALIKWGRRPLAVTSREQRANRVEQQLARLEREREYERALRPFLPVR